MKRVCLGLALLSCSMTAPAAEVYPTTYWMCFVGYDLNTYTNDPRQKYLYLAQSDDGQQWALAPGFTAYSGSAADLIRRSNTLYIYSSSPNQLVRYHVDTGVYDPAVTPVVRTSSGSNETYIAPAPFLDSDGLMAMFYLRQDVPPPYDPCKLAPWESNGTARVIHSAVETPGSDGAEFTVTDGDRLAVALTGSQQLSDPDIFLFPTGYVLYVGRGSDGIQAYTAGELHGSFTPMTGLSNGVIVAGGVGQVACSYYHVQTAQYWTYTDSPDGILRGLHAGLTNTLTRPQFTSVIVPTNFFAASYTVEQAAMAVNAFLDAPAGVAAGDGVDSNKVAVSWSAVSNATGYTVWRSTSNATSSAGQIGAAASAAYDDTTAIAGRTYFYWARATNAFVASAFSGSDSGYLPSSSGSSNVDYSGNDYDGDGQSDLAIFDSNTGNWFVRTLSGTAIVWSVQWGWPGAKAVEGDYDGDGVSDLAVFDGNTGYWYIRTVAGATLAWGVGWGWPGAIPVSGDYDADGLSDLSVFDNNTGSWFVRSMATNVLAWNVSWGWPGAIPVPGDFNGEGVSDLAVFDGNTGSWYIRTVGGSNLVWAATWGWPGAVPVGGDYNGDGTDDIAVFDGNTGYWYIRTMAGDAIAWQVAWGWPGAVPVPGDFNGDAQSDLAVFDGNTGKWYIRTMGGTTLAWAVAWGWPGAIPVGSLNSYY